MTIGVTSSSGIETVEEIPAAVETPGLNGDSVLGYAVIGFSSASSRSRSVCSGCRRSVAPIRAG